MGFCRFAISSGRIQRIGPATAPTGDLSVVDPHGDESHCEVNLVSQQEPLFLRKSVRISTPGSQMFGFT